MDFEQALESPVCLLWLRVTRRLRGLFFRKRSVQLHNNETRKQRSTFHSTEARPALHVLYAAHDRGHGMRITDHALLLSVSGAGGLAIALSMHARTRKQRKGRAHNQKRTAPKRPRHDVKGPVTVSPGCRRSDYVHTRDCAVANAYARLTPVDTYSKRSGAAVESTAGREGARARASRPPPSMCSDRVRMSGRVM